MLAIARNQLAGNACNVGFSARLYFNYTGSYPDYYPIQWVIRVSGVDPVTTLMSPGR